MPKLAIILNCVMNKFLKNSDHPHMFKGDTIIIIVNDVETEIKLHTTCVLNILVCWQKFYIWRY